jgi:hypothetical protein
MAGWTRLYDTSGLATGDVNATSRVRNTNDTKDKNIIKLDKNLSELRFKDQQFLFEFWHIILKKLEIGQSADKQSGVTKPTLYYKLGDSAETIVNQLTCREGAGEFLNIKNNQLSALVPKIRLFKIINYGKGKTGGEREVEFSFIDNTDVKKIVEDRIGRGAGVGLQSFSWDFQGTNPAESDKLITAEAVFVFQTLEELFRNRGGYSFADLTFFNLKSSQNKLLEEEKCALEQSTVETTSEGAYYIRAEVGWAFPKVNKEFFVSLGFENESAKKIKRALENSCYNFLIYPLNHQLAINEEGVATITFKFQAAIEDIIGVSPYANILGTGEEDTKLIESIKERNKAVKWGLENLKVSAERKKAGTEKEYEEASHATFNVNEKNLKKLGLPIEKHNQVFNESEIKKYGMTEALQKVKEEEIDAAAEKLNASGPLGEQVYGTLLNKLVENNLLYQAKLPTGAYDKWIKNLTATDEQKSIVAGEDISIQPLLEVYASEGERAKEIKNSIEKHDFDAAQKSSKGYKNVLFFFYGDLVEVALQIINKRDKQKLTEKMGFILGPIEVQGTLPDKTERRSIADIPISIEFFQEWFTKTIIKPGITEYTLKNFFRSSIASLIEGVLHSVKSKDETERKQLLGMTLVHVPVVNGVDTIQKTVSGKKNKEGETKTLWLEEYKKAIAVKNFDSVKPFLVIYFSKVPNFSVKDMDYKRDEKDGIYHLYPGSDTGIVLNINYEKTNIEGFYESQLISRKGEVLDVYNCKLKLVGNTLFKNGDLVYIEPSSLLGSFGEFRSAAKRLGMLGYYRVVKVNSKIDIGEYETNLDCIAEIAKRGGCNEKKAIEKITTKEYIDIKGKNS